MISLSGDEDSTCTRRVSAAGHDSDYIDDCPQSCSQHSKPHLRSKFLMRCQSFGMSQGAIDSWEKLFVQTEAAIVLWVAVVVVTTGLYAYLFVGAPADGIYSHVFRVPLGVVLVNQGFNAIGIWRNGQPFMNGFVAKFMILLSTPCVLLIMVAGYICPMDSVPFDSTLHLTAVLTVLTWLLNCFAAFVPMALPSEPCRQLLSVLFSALMSTIRSIDAATDLSFLRVLAVQVRTLGCIVVGLCAHVPLTGNAP